MKCSVGVVTPLMWVNIVCINVVKMFPYSAALYGARVLVENSKYSSMWGLPILLFPMYIFSIFFMQASVEKQILGVGVAILLCGAPVAGAWSTTAVTARGGFS